MKSTTFDVEPDFFTVNENDSSYHVRIYQESGGVWSQVGSDIDEEYSGIFARGSVSLSSDGTRVAIGAYSHGNNTNGHVRIYQESGGLWSQIGSDIDGEASGDGLGRVSLSSDGTRVAIGVPGNDGNGTNAGHVRIYEESGGVWSQMGNDIDGEAAEDYSGWSVSLSSDGTRVAIGAPFIDGNDSIAGYVSIYEESGGVWSQVGSDIDGASVSLSSDGTSVAIGGPLTHAGHVRVFDLSLSTVAISDPNFNADIKLNVFPNPSNETFYIESGKDVKTLLVTDLNGKIIKTIPVHGATNHTIDLIGVESGIYLLQAKSAQSSKILQLIKP